VRADGRFWRPILVGALTLVAAVAWHVAFQAWIPNTTHRYDLAESFVQAWSGLTWITLFALGLATLANARASRLLVTVAVAAMTFQGLAALKTVQVGLSDGVITPQGGLVAALSIAQIGLTWVWIVLIAQSKRIPAGPAE
jgi:hypothetical protein